MCELPERYGILPDRLYDPCRGVHSDDTYVNSYNCVSCRRCGRDIYCAKDIDWSELPDYWDQ